MTLPSILALAVAAAVAASAAHAIERLSVEALASRVDGGQLEFRGSGLTARGFESVIWRFTPDGRVVGEGATSRIVGGGIFDQFGIKGIGRWRRAGDSICVAWDANNRRFDGCYGVFVSGRTVHLTGPNFLAGTGELVERAPAQNVAGERCPSLAAVRRASTAPSRVASRCGLRMR